MDDLNNTEGGEPQRNDQNAPDTEGSDPKILDAEESDQQIADAKESNEMVLKKNIEDNVALEEKQSAKKKHEVTQDWINLSYDIIKKAIILGFGGVGLLTFRKLLLTHDISIDKIIELSTVLLQSGKLNIIAISVAVIFVARFLLLLVTTRKKDSGKE